MGNIHDFLMQVIEFSAMVVATLILIGLAAVVVMYIVDVTQTQQAIRKNYPVIGRFRYLFEHMGVFFRQYFFAMDREELPFNRAQRGWIASCSSTALFRSWSRKPNRPTGRHCGSATAMPGNPTRPTLYFTYQP